MIKKVIIAILLLNVNLCASQVTVRIYGKVTGEKDTVGIPNIAMTLKEMRGRVFHDTTDAQGHYEFVFKKNFITVAEFFPDSIGRNRAYYFTCFGGMYNTGKIVVEDTINKSTELQKDFILSGPTKEMVFPTIFFKKNSTEYERANYGIDNMDVSSALKVLAHQLNTLDKGMTLVVAAHSSTDEKKPDELSIKRAQKVIDELINLGVKKERLKGLGYGIQKTTNNMQASRRCVFKVLSWDFKE